MTGQHIERLRAHRNNICRYRRLLATSLTDLERCYIERRLLDERASVKALLREAYPDRLSLRTTKPGADRRTTLLELTEFLHPAGAFKHPLDVLDDPDLTAYEKRAILSSWLADHCLGEDLSHLNPRRGDTSVRLEDIVDALSPRTRRPRSSIMNASRIERSGAQDPSSLQTVGIMMT